ncbi:2-hydroxy-3-oxopropionate reductase [candidate division KSB1 bacterium]|nr:2-hydroxy-3-oxopropionate reductase [candidate division KSB1 bacterium]
MEKIGFIGIGIMGKPMALNLIEAGYDLVVMDIDKKAVKEVTAQGAKSAETAKAVAEQTDVIITMLPDSPDVEQAVLGPDGVAEGIKAGSLFIDMSTIAPATSQKIAEVLAKKDVQALDAPVSGGEVGAINGALSIMVGGPETAFERAMPLFEIMGKNIVLIGEAGAGQVTKASNQIIVGMTIQAVAEAMNLAKKAGVDIVRVREALLGGFAQSRILDLHGQRIIDNNYKPGFKVKLHRKDMNIALQTGRELSVPLPGSALVASQMDAILAKGDGELDHSALALFLSQLSGLE